MAKNKIISDRLNTFFTNNKMTVGESIPTTGTWSKGDIVISTLQANGECGWICIEAGTPGKWEIFGAGGGGGSLVTINTSVTIDTPVSEISLSGLGVSVTPKDKLMVHYNSTHLFEGVDFEIIENGTKIRKLGTGKWNESSSKGSLFVFELLKVAKNITGGEVKFDGKIVEKKSNKTISSPTSEVAIGIDGFNKENHSLTVYRNSTYMIEGIDYDISADSKKIVSKKGNWNEASSANYIFSFIALKEVYDTDPDAKIGTGNIIDKSVTMEKLADDVRQAIIDAGNIDLSAYALKADLGNKTQLQTSNKSNIVAAINEVFQSGVSTKSGMKDAINSKITVPDVIDNDSWSTYIQRVKDIKEGRGNAQVGDVLAGKTFTGDDGIMKTGTIPNRGGAQTITPGTSNKVLNSGYYSGDITIAGDTDLIAANIISGKNIFGVMGTATLASLGGKKFASGSVATVTTPENLKGTITVSGLTFTPNIIIATNGTYACLYIRDIGNTYFSIYGVLSSEGACLKYDLANTSEINHYVNSSGFRLRVNPMRYHTNSVTVTWYAFG